MDLLDFLYNIMAENKKSFVLYADLIGRIEHLTTEEKGVLFQHLLEYVNDLNPVLEDRVLIGVWKPIEQQLKRDLKKFEQVKSKRSEAGKRSAELRSLKKDKQTSTNSTSVKSVQQVSTNSTVNDNVNVNVSVNDNVNDINNINILFKEKIKKDKGYLEIVSMQKKININKATSLIDEFDNMLILTGKKHNDLKEYKSHFGYWLNQKEIEQPTKKRIAF